jgi:hypothetical protein
MSMPVIEVKGKINVSTLSWTETAIAICLFD